MFFYRMIELERVSEDFQPPSKALLFLVFQKSKQISYSFES